MHACSLLTSANDIVLEQKIIISTALLHDYRKHDHIKMSNKISRKPSLSNENPSKSQNTNGNAMPNAELSNV